MADSTIEKNGAPKAPKGAKRSLGTPVWIAICAVALVVGVLCGHFLLSNGSGAASGKTTLSESDLDSTIATYTYDGSSHAITAREVLQQNGSLENQANSDGSYNVPSADDILSYARNPLVPTTLRPSAPTTAWTRTPQSRSSTTPRSSRSSATP